MLASFLWPNFLVALGTNCQEFHPISPWNLFVSVRRGVKIYSNFCAQNHFYKNRQILLARIALLYLVRHFVYSSLPATLPLYQYPCHVVHPNFYNLYWNICYIFTFLASKFSGIFRWISRQWSWDAGFQRVFRPKWPVWWRDENQPVSTILLLTAVTVSTII